jgi:hypothetical protein
MDRDLVQAHAQGLCDALVAGEIERATEDFSNELRANLGQLIAMLPLPITEATVESVDLGGKSYAVVLRLVGEVDVVFLQTRWKERDGRPTVVEASHIVEQVAPPTAEEEPAEDSGS